MGMGMGKWLPFRTAYPPSRSRLGVFASISGFLAYLVLFLAIPD